MQQIRVKKGGSGWGYGVIGVMIFSGSLPATRLAVGDFDPCFLTVARAAIAGLVALLLLCLFPQPRPAKRQVLSLLVVALGVVVGFPLLTAMALKYITAGHSIVFIGLLPLATACFGVLRGGDKPAAGFWWCALCGSGLVSGYAFTQPQSGALQGDLLMLGAIVLCGAGYAEGGRLTRTLGGWQVISWALVLALPVMLLLCLWMTPPVLSRISVGGWLALGYVSLFSMLIGFIFWYQGLALGGIAAVGQLQLLQPLFGFALAAMLLDEPVSPGMISIGIGVVLCVAGSRYFARRVK